MLTGPEATYGKPKDLCDITLEDFQQYPIWVWALDQEGVEGQDETWMKPITNTTEVKAAAFDLTATILLKAVDTETFAVSEYDLDAMKLMGISVWHNNEWGKLQSVGGLSFPVALAAVPTIDGREGVLFLCESSDPENPRRIS